MTGTRRKQPKRGILYYLGLGLSAGLLGFLLLIGALVIAVPAISGATPMTILTSSMEPTYPPGTLIIVKPVDIDEITIGEPITFQLESGKPEVVTHRVVAISVVEGEKSFTTKGDNNAVADAVPVMPVQVRGVVWYAVPYIGFANTFINGDNRSWIVPIAALGLFVYAGYMLVSGVHHSVVRRRRQQAKAAAAETPVEALSLRN
jgi:signal peptidase